MQQGETWDFVPILGLKQSLLRSMTLLANLDWGSSKLRTSLTALRLIYSFATKWRESKRKVTALFKFSFKFGGCFKPQTHRNWRAVDIEVVSRFELKLSGRERLISLSFGSSPIRLILANSGDHKYLPRVLVNKLKRILQQTPVFGVLICMHWYK